MMFCEANGEQAFFLSFIFSLKRDSSRQRLVSVSIMALTPLSTLHKNVCSVALKTNKRGTLKRQK